MRALLSFFPLLTAQQKRFVWSLVLSLITLAAGIALLGTSGWFLTATAISTLGSAFNIFGPSAGVRGFSFIRILSRYGEKLVGHDATLRLLSDLRYWLFSRLFPVLPLPGRFGRSELVSRLVADVNALDNAFLLALGPVSTAILAGIAMSLGIAVVMPEAAIAYAISFFAAALLVPAVLVIASRKLGHQTVMATAGLRQAVLDGLDGHQDLVVFGATDQALHAADQATDELARSRFRSGAASAIASGAVQFFTGVALVTTLYFGLKAHDAGTINGPVMASIVLAVMASFEATATLVRGAGRLTAAASAAERLREIADLEPAICEPERPSPVPAGGTIAFEKVSFGYDIAKPVFSDLSFEIATGACAAIVGPSGAGKSTISKLVTRLADPNGGTVRLNGVDLRTIAEQDLRARVVMMTQDAPVFLDTVRNNLLVGREDATDAELWEVLAAVNLKDFIASQKSGLATPCGEAGMTFSAGQARRLCLARTLLSRADVIVLDEPTTGLDRETELNFLQDLPKISAGRTMIVITHAELPDAGFDPILRLKAGRLLNAA